MHVDYTYRTSIAIFPLHEVKGRQKSVFQFISRFSKKDKNKCPFFKNGLEIGNEKMPISDLDDNALIYIFFRFHSLA